MVCEFCVKFSVYQQCILDMISSRPHIWPALRHLIKLCTSVFSGGVCLLVRHKSRRIGRCVRAGLDIDWCHRAPSGSERIQIPRIDTDFSPLSKTKMQTTEASTTAAATPATASTRALASEFYGREGAGHCPDRSPASHHLRGSDRHPLTIMPL